MTVAVAEQQVEPPQVDPVNTPLKEVAAAMKSACTMGQDGTAKVVAKARGAVPATRVSRFVYSSCFYLSYGVVFPTMYIVTFVPGCGPVASGLRDGAKAANDAIVDIMEQSAALAGGKRDAAFATGSEIATGS